MAILKFFFSTFLYILQFSNGNNSLNKQDRNIVSNSKFHLTQFIDKSTTFEGTTIDLVFSNLSDITAVALPNMWSSHHTLNITVPK